MPECIRIDQQHYLAGHDRLETLVHRLDAESPLDLDKDANAKFMVR